MKTTPLKTQGRILVAHCRVARDFFTRFLGLMGRRGLEADAGILFPKCTSIHTFFMRFSIDVVFIDDNGQVISVQESVSPWRLVLPRRGVRHILELGANRCRELGITAGTVLKCEGMWV